MWGSFFEGLGTALIQIAIGIVLSIGSGVVGYAIGIRKSAKQKQTAGNNSRQVQIADLSDSLSQKAKNIDKDTTINQVQKAGDDSIQFQVGEDKNVR